MSGPLSFSINVIIFERSIIDTLFLIKKGIQSNIGFMRGLTDHGTN